MRSGIDALSDLEQDLALGFRLGALADFYSQVIIRAGECRGALPDSMFQLLARLQQQCFGARAHLDMTGDVTNDKDSDNRDQQRLKMRARSEALLLKASE